jgi:hypothetical protein
MRHDPNKAFDADAQEIGRLTTKLFDVVASGNCVIADLAALGVDVQFVPVDPFQLGPNGARLNRIAVSILIDPAPLT